MFTYKYLSGMLNAGMVPVRELLSRYRYWSDMLNQGMVPVS